MAGRKGQAGRTARGFNLVATQNNGYEERIYLFSGKAGN